MRRITWTAVLLAMCLVVACHSRGPDGRWPEINPGCERIKLFRPGKPPARPYQVLRDFQGHWSEPDKNLRNWLVNKACAAGAHAVIDVIESKGRDGSGPVWNIQGTAVVYE